MYLRKCTEIVKLVVFRLPFNSGVEVIYCLRVLVIVHVETATVEVRVRFAFWIITVYCLTVVFEGFAGLVHDVF